LLRYAAGRGQVPGGDVGQLPAGALPMTSAHGLAKQVAYTECAADQVAAQTGKLPTLDGTCPKVDKPTKPAHTGGGSGTPGTTGGSVPTGVPSAPDGGTPSTGTPGTGNPPVVTASDLKTVGAYSALGHFGMPVALIFTLWLALAGITLRWGDQMLRAARLAGPAGARLWALRPRRSVGKRRREGDEL
ncbi:MAG TPA: hypothetical protein VJ872_10850, partial [Nocardioides sp.]|nr:hypothetical protein [Nocardioides sp.]